MDERFERLIADNPNLSTSAICRLTGLSIGEVNKARVKPLWSYKGVGIPFMCFVNRKNQACYQVSAYGRLIFNGLFYRAIEYVDMVIYCLENNKGKLPLTRKESYFVGLEFIKRDNHHSN